MNDVCNSLVIGTENAGYLNVCCGILRVAEKLYVSFTAVGQAVACAPVTQRARVRSPVGTSFLGGVFSGFFLNYKTNVGKL